MGDAPRVLIVKMSSMGDVIHAFPAVTDIAAAFPGAAIDWVVEEGFSGLPRLHPAVRRVLPVALRRWRQALFSPATWREWRAARRAVRAHPYDAVIDLQGLMKSAWVTRWAQGPAIGFDAASAREPLATRAYARRVAVPRSLHAIERNRVLAAQALGYAVEGRPRYALRVPPLSPDWRPYHGEGPYAVLLTNASRATKLWPAEAWRLVEADLAARGLRSLLVWGSEAEGEASRERAQGMRNAVVVPRAPLDQLAALLAGAQVVIGLDTGLTHLAAAVGAPTIGVFCDYDPALVGITGDAPCFSLGSAAGGPPAEDVVAALARLPDLAPRASATTGGEAARP